MRTITRYMRTIGQCSRFISRWNGHRRSRLAAVTVAFVVRGDREKTEEIDEDCVETNSETRGMDGSMAYPGGAIRV